MPFDGNFALHGLLGGPDLLQDRVGGGCTAETILSLLSRACAVKGHIRKILQKLKANDRAHAVTIAIKRGFFDL